ncbi:MAG: hypothetical protein Q9164_007156, partial [Protoblastenia rupestris]
MADTKCLDDIICLDDMIGLSVRDEDRETVTHQSVKSVRITGTDPKRQVLVAGPRRPQAHELAKSDTSVSVDKDDDTESSAEGLDEDQLRALKQGLRPEDAAVGRVPCAPDVGLREE